MTTYGLDLSVHNITVDFNAVKKAGHDFVILRAGFGKYIDQKDSKFEEYYQKAKAAGLKVGAYWYSYALNVTDAHEEAKICMQVIKDKTFEYPVWLDMEDADGYKAKNGSPSNVTLVAICEAFCEDLEEAGYYAGVYASSSWFKNQLSGLSKNYDRWIASWGNNDATLSTGEMRDDCHLHQFTSTYYLNGKRFDRNVVYGDYDYASIIKEAGLNGFKKGSPSDSGNTNTENAPSGSIMDLATDVLKGKYGNDEERVKKLGDKYDEVQAEVNHRLTASVSVLAQEVIDGRYGVGQDRVDALGTRYDEIQSKVNQMLGSSSAIYYTVESGDNLTSIAARYNTTVDEIVRLNKINDPNLIYPNQKLRVK